MTPLSIKDNQLIMTKSLTTLSILSTLFLFIARTVTIAQVQTSHPFTIIVKNDDRRPNNGFIKGTRVNNNKKRRIWWKGKRDITIQNNDTIYFTSIPDSDLSISSSTWDSIQTLKTYMSKKRKNPKDNIIEGTIYLVNKSGKSKPAQCVEIHDANDVDNSVYTDILGRFAILIDPLSGPTSKKLEICFDKCRNLKDIYIPPVIDLTITITDRDRTKIDVYVDDLGNKKKDDTGDSNTP